MLALGPPNLKPPPPPKGLGLALSSRLTSLAFFVGPSSGGPRPSGSPLGRAPRRLRIPPGLLAAETLSVLSLLSAAAACPALAKALLGPLEDPKENGVLPLFAPALVLVLSVVLDPKDKAGLLASLAAEVVPVVAPSALAPAGLLKPPNLVPPVVEVSPELEPLSLLAPKVGTLRGATAVLLLALLLVPKAVLLLPPKAGTTPPSLFSVVTIAFAGLEPNAKGLLSPVDVIGGAGVDPPNLIPLPSGADAGAGVAAGFLAAHEGSPVASTNFLLHAGQTSMTASMLATSQWGHFK